MSLRQSGGRIPDVIDEIPRLRTRTVGAVGQYTTIRCERRVYGDQRPVVLLRGMPAAADVVRSLRSWQELDDRQQHPNPRDETALRARSLALRASVSPCFAAMAANTRCLAQQLRCMLFPRRPEFLSRPSVPCTTDVLSASRCKQNYWKAATDGKQNNQITELQDRVRVMRSRSRENSARPGQAKLAGRR